MENVKLTIAKNIKVGKDNVDEVSDIAQKYGLTKEEIAELKELLGRDD